MSLFTVTFDSSDSNDGEAPVPFMQPVILPREPENSNRSFRTRVNRHINQVENHVTVTKEIIEAETVVCIQEPKIKNFQETKRNEKRTRVRQRKNRNQNGDNDESKQQNYEEDKISSDGYTDSGDKQQSTSETVTSESTQIEEKVGFTNEINKRIKSEKKLTSYKLNIDKDVTWKGKRYHLQLIHNEKPLYHTKLKSRAGNSEIVVSEGDECHYSSNNFPAVIIPSKNNSFSCRTESRDGPEFLSISVVRGNKDPRTMTVKFTKPIEGVPEEICSRPSIKTSSGRWVLDVSGRNAICSIKNTILVNKKDEEWIVVLKVKQNTILIETDQKLNPLIAFCVGVASYVCKE